MQEDMRMTLPAVPEKTRLLAAALRLLAALGIEGDVDDRALAALHAAHAPGSYGPDQIRRAVEDVLGDVVYEDIDWTAVEAFRRAHLPAAERPEVRITIGMDTQGGEAAYVAFWPEPGKPLVIRPQDWLLKDVPASAVQVDMATDAFAAHFRTETGDLPTWIRGHYSEIREAMAGALAKATAAKDL